MKTTFAYHDLLNIDLFGENSILREYCDLEFSQGNVATVTAQNHAATLSITITGRQQEFHGTTYSLGKGIFYNEDSDLILVSKDRDTSFFNPRKIYTTITNFTKDRTDIVSVTVNNNVMTSDSFESRLQDAYRRIIKLDPRCRHRRNAESFVSEVLEPNIYRLFRARQHVLLHSAALDADGKGILILGPQNVGKTTTAIQLARSGMRLLADDLCLVAPNGKLLSYLKPIKLEREILAKSEFARAAARRENKARDPAATSILLALGRDTSGYEIKVSPEHLGIPTTSQSQVKWLFFLQRSSSTSKTSPPPVQEISVETAADLCIFHQLAEFDGNKRLDLDIRHHLALLFGHNKIIPAVDDQCRASITSALDGTKSYVLTMQDPTQDPARIIEELIH
jgi:hypothetical protein